MEDLIDVNPNIAEEVEQAERSSGNESKTPEEAIRKFVDEKKDDMKSKAGEVKENISEKASRASDKISETWSDTKETIADKSDRARETISEKAGRAKDSIIETTSSMGEKASSWMHGVAQSIGLEKKATDFAGQEKIVERDVVKPAGSEFLPPPVTDTSRLNEPIWPTKEQSDEYNPSIIHSLFGHGPHHKSNEHEGTIHSLGPMVDTSADHVHPVDSVVGNESGLIGSHPVQTHTHKGFFGGMFGGAARDVNMDESDKLQKDAIKYDQFLKDSGKEREGRDETKTQNKITSDQLVD